MSEENLLADKERLERYIESLERQLRIARNSTDMYKQERIDEIAKEISTLYKRKNEIDQKLSEIEWNKPKNVAKRNREEQEKKLEERRKKHEENFKNLNKLIEYLKLAGLNDLANRLNIMRFYHMKARSSYVKEEIVLRADEKTVKTGTKTTKKEYRQIKKQVIRLTKQATRMIKKYKGLVKLYDNAWLILKDIKDKGITQDGMPMQEFIDTLYKYFREPKSTYCTRDYENYYSYKTLENLGYKYLDFYRDLYSKYNEDVRKHKI